MENEQIGKVRYTCWIYIKFDYFFVDVQLDTKLYIYKPNLTHVPFEHQSKHDF
jgi:hypothetical protein